MMPKSAMIFAAGKGTRMKHLTLNKPKPLIQVAGRALIDHTLDIVASAGVAKTVVNSHYLGNQIHDHLTDANVTCISEPTLLETGGGLRNAVPELGEGPVFTLNSDAVWTGPNPIETLRNAWDADRMDALLLLVPRARARGYTGDGDFIITPSSHISRGAGDVYSGAQIIRTDGLAKIEDRVFSLNRLWDQMLLDGRIFGVIHDGGWCDVGHPDGIRVAEDMLKGVNNV